MGFNPAILLKLEFKISGGKIRPTTPFKKLSTAVLIIFGSLLPEMVVFSLEGIYL